METDFRLQESHREEAKSPTVPKHLKGPRLLIAYIYINMNCSCKPVVIKISAPRETHLFRDGSDG